jgi:hypothetical protein
MVGMLAWSSEDPGFHPLSAQTQKQVLLLLLIAACLVEKQQVVILSSLI